jgi:putative GTP pyrophosphokinase
MAYIEPKYTKTQTDKAGYILTDTNADIGDIFWADEVLGNWRAAHSYPMNTFQATLRGKLWRVDKRAIVGQRLKRALSIRHKLERFPTMRLSRMQDIGGLRAVMSSIEHVKRLETNYRRTRFQHQLVASKDYIANPKKDGYRGIHLVYRYKNSRTPKYNGLHVELQIRTYLQHAWATAVETMGSFLGQALKAGEGENDWREFFVISSAAIAMAEKCTPVPDFEGQTEGEISRQLKKSESSLRVIDKLEGFAIAADHIKMLRGRGAYHLVILDTSEKSVTIRPYPVRLLSHANKDYAEVERRAKAGEPVEAVLVSAGPIEALKKAYPNYFLDTQSFIRETRKMIAKADNT